MGCFVPQEAGWLQQKTALSKGFYVFKPKSGKWSSSLPTLLKVLMLRSCSAA
jgi:hypothetical protein